MSNVTAKTSSNVFYKARCEAATHNEQLSSRDRIESGIANPYPEEIHLMADLYNAPELKNYFCKNICPLGEDIPQAEVADLDRITVRTLSAIRKLGETKELLLDITEDGVIDETEKDDMEKVLRNLEELEQIAQNMKLWIKKNL